MFSTERTYDLEERVVDFVVSFSVGVHVKDYSDLSELVDIGAEAVAALDRAVPTLGQTGTALGSVVVGIPRGRRILDEFRLYVAKAKHTQEVRATVGAAARRLKQATVHAFCARE